MKNIFLSAALLVITSTAAFSQANTTLSNLVSPTSVNQNLIPSSNNGKNLGSSSKGWKNGYFTNAIYLYGFKIIDASIYDYGPENTGFGNQALNSLNTGDPFPGLDNAAFGFKALYSNIAGEANTGIGSQSLVNNFDGTENTAIGFAAMYDNIGGGFGHGSYNTATGTVCLHNNPWDPIIPATAMRRSIVIIPAYIILRLVKQPATMSYQEVTTLLLVQ